MKVAKVDLRVSEFAPDRDAALKSHAASKAQKRYEEMDRMYREWPMHFIEQRIAAVKRGEVFNVPSPSSMMYSYR